MRPQHGYNNNTSKVDRGITIGMKMDKNAGLGDASFVYAKE